VYVRRSRLPTLSRILKRGDGYWLRVTCNDRGTRLIISVVHQLCDPRELRGYRRFDNYFPDGNNTWAATVDTVYGTSSHSPRGNRERDTRRRRTINNYVNARDNRSE